MLHVIDQCTWPRKILPWIWAGWNLIIFSDCINDLENKDKTIVEMKKSINDLETIKLQIVELQQQTSELECIRIS